MGVLRRLGDWISRPAPLRGAYVIPGTNMVTRNRHCPLLRGKPCAKCERFPEGYGAERIPTLSEDGQVLDEWHP